MLGVDDLLIELFRNAGAGWLSRRRNREKTAQVKKFLREKIRRELAVNRAIIDDFRNDTTLSDVEKGARSVLLLKTDAMADIFSDAIDLDELLPLELSEGLKKIMAGNDGQRARRIATIKSESELFERIWLRVAVAKVRAAENLSVGDVLYIHQLMLGLELSLRREVPQKTGWIRHILPGRDLYVADSTREPA